MTFLESYNAFKNAVLKEHIDYSYYNSQVSKELEKNGFRKEKAMFDKIQALARKYNADDFETGVEPSIAKIQNTALRVKSNLRNLPDYCYVFFPWYNPDSSTPSKSIGFLNELLTLDFVDKNKSYVSGGVDNEEREYKDKTLNQVASLDLVCITSAHIYIKISSEYKQAIENEAETYEKNRLEKQARVISAAEIGDEIGLPYEIIKRGSTTKIVFDNQELSGNEYYSKMSEVMEKYDLGHYEVTYKGTVKKPEILLYVKTKENPKS